MRARSFHVITVSVYTPALILTHLISFQFSKYSTEYCSLFSLRLGSVYGPQDANIGNSWKHFKCYPFTSFMAPITIYGFSLHLWFTFVLLLHLLHLKYTPCWDGTVCSPPYPQPLTHQLATEDAPYIFAEWMSADAMSESACPLPRLQGLESLCLRTNPHSATS